MDLCNVSVTVDFDASLQELWYRLSMVTVPVCHKTAANAARLKPAAFLNLPKWNPRVKKQCSRAIANDVSVPSAPRREYLDVHDQKAMPA